MGWLCLWKGCDPLLTKSTNRRQDRDPALARQPVADRHRETISGAEKVAPSAKDDRRALTIAEIERIIGKFARLPEPPNRPDLILWKSTAPTDIWSASSFQGRTTNARTAMAAIWKAGCASAWPPWKPCAKRSVKNFLSFICWGPRKNGREALPCPKAGPLPNNCKKPGPMPSISRSARRQEKAMNASPGPKAKMGTYVPLAEAIKKEVTVPVMAVGRIN